MKVSSSRAVPLVLLLASLLWPASLRVVAAPPRLAATAESRLTLDGRPFRGLGVNVYDLFERSLGPAPRTNAAEVLGVLASNGIPFVRFSASGYWPAEWGLYRTNRTEFFARFDLVVHAAERAGVGLIPSVFWNPPTVSDLAGEPFNAWGDPQSKTWALARAYLGDLVERYRGSAAIWAWEFGNELNLPADLPNAADHRPPVVPDLGTPAGRGPGDDLTYDSVHRALKEFGAEVRRRDPARLIVSGNAFPRVSAWHQWHEKSWTHDTPEQAAAMLAEDNPDPLGLLSVRLYDADDEKRIGGAMVVARRSGKPLFVGEFGVPGVIDGPALARFRDMLGLFERESVPLAALWVFDFDGQAADWNVTPTNGRKALFEAVVAWNRRQKAAGP